MEKKRLVHMDLLKCIAIFFVITYHSTLYFYDITQENSVINYLLYFSRTILSTCVPLFFFANGYLLFNKGFNTKKHVMKIFRLILLTLIWAFLLMPLYMIIAGVPLDIKTIFLSILQLDVSWSMNIFWFIGALICMYILFPALKALFDSNKEGFIFFIIACGILTFGLVLCNQVLMFTKIFFHHDLKSIDAPFITMINPFRGSYGYTFVYFCVGGLIYTYEDKIRAIPKLKRNLVSVIGILVSCTFLFLIGIYYSNFVDGKIWDVVWNGYDTIFTFFNVIFIYILCLNYTNNNYFIKIISSNTLGIYFTHRIIIRLTREWITLHDFLCNFLVNIIYAFLIMCVCLLICKIFRKIHILRKLI